MNVTVNEISTTVPVCAKLSIDEWENEIEIMERSDLSQHVDFLLRIRASPAISASHSILKLPGRPVTKTVRRDSEGNQIWSIDAAVKVSDLI